MTPPRQILPGTSFEICTRTLARTYRLLPCAQVNNLFLYVLGVAAQRYGITLYGLVVMITHYHLLGLDLHGRLPEFVCYFNSLFARALNAYQGLDDKVWSGDGYHLLRPQSADDLLERMTYIMSNPVSADLVDRAADFPGVLINPRDIGRTIIVERPNFFFREDSTMPERVELRFEVPEEFTALGREQYVDLLQQKLRVREREARSERRADGRVVLGCRRCRQAALGRRSRTWEQWFRLRPTIAARLKAQRVEAIRDLKAFRARYYEALAAWREGVDDVVFPPGTWWMCQFAGAAVG